MVSGTLSQKEESLWPRVAGLLVEAFTFCYSRIFVQ